MTWTDHTSADARRAMIIPFLFVLSGCRHEESDLTRFRQLTPDRTGVTFANTVTTSDSLNALTNPYVYNGAGVGVGDLDNDGLPDMFFAGNMVSSRLYLNKGNMRFEDITAAAGVTTRRWATGVTMVDINQDGWLDIYVSVSGPEWSSRADRVNLLFLNDGDRTFTEAAARYGIADSGFTTHATFLDYDGDGDLDLFLLNNSPKDFGRGQIMLPLAVGIRPRTPDHYNELYRNNGDGSFSKVSQQAGIRQDVGYGLGVAVADIDADGRPDIYVSNDITPNDVLYVNNGDGTFRDEAGRWLKHTSFAGMGVDIADFNNDGRPDILQADMMPPALLARKRVSGYLSYDDAADLRRRGFRIDYGTNALQLHGGVANQGDVVFSDIARLAGVAYTDWSWSTLLADFDNDGFKDIFITNGYPKAINDLDYKVAAFAAQRAQNTPRVLELLRKLHGYRVANYLFRNNGDLTFTDRSAAWGMDQPGFSYGAAYTDLNNDGKLDLVVNNMDAPAAIYENAAPMGDTHYLRIELRGETPNLRGIGATLEVVARGQKQYLYQSPYRGYMSTVDDRLHFGLGAAARVDTLKVTWPDGRHQVLTNVAGDQMVTLTQTEALQRSSRQIPDTRHRPFQPMAAALRPRYAQPETGDLDFAIQPLLPYQISKQGPPLAVGDVNGDGLEDVFVGGLRGAPAKLFLQRANGGFVESSPGQPWAADQAYEDWGARLFDANGDGRLDLYVASGGYGLSPVSRLLQDRLYVNVGGGRFVRDSSALPGMLTSTASIAVGDFTGDGRPDLFVGGRLASRNYPYPARSYLLRNEGSRFTDVTEAVAPELARPTGMITAAVWIDFDGDGRLDLVTAGEWMPLRFFKNDGARLHDVTSATGLGPMRGWWYSLAAGDFNHDGRPDLVAGNLGMNTYPASGAAPVGVYAADFTGHQTTDVVLTERQDGREYPAAGLYTLGRAIYTVGLQVPTNAAFGSASVQELLSPGQLRRALHYEVDTFASLYVQNNGDGTFTRTALPNLAQISPIRGIIAHDVNGDGHLDLIVAGNVYDTEPNTPAADAGNGLWLKGDGRGHFTPVPPGESGFVASRDVAGLALIATPAGKAVLVANSGDSLQAFTIRNP